MPTFAFELPINLAVLAALGALVWAFRADSFSLNILAGAFLFAGLATAWNIVGGFCGQFSLGHSVFFATGAYTTANLYLKLQVSPWLALIPSALLAALMAVAVSWPVFRLRGPFFAFATMAFTEVLLSLAMYFEGDHWRFARNIGAFSRRARQYDIQGQALLRPADARLSRRRADRAERDRAKPPRLPSASDPRQRGCRARGRHRRPARKTGRDGHQRRAHRDRRRVLPYVRTRRRSADACSRCSTSA